MEFDHSYMLCTCLCTLYFFFYLFVYISNYSIVHLFINVFIHYIIHRFLCSFIDLSSCVVIYSYLSIHQCVYFGEKTCQICVCTCVYISHMCTYWIILKYLRGARLSSICNLLSVDLVTKCWYPCFGTIEALSRIWRKSPLWVLKQGTL